MTWIYGGWDRLAAALLAQPDTGPAGYRQPDIAPIIRASREHLSLASPLVLLGVNGALVLLDFLFLVRTGRTLRCPSPGTQRSLLAGLSRTHRTLLIPDLLRLCRTLVTLAAMDRLAREHAPH